MLCVPGRTKVYKCISVHEALLVNRYKCGVYPEVKLCVIGMFCGCCVCALQRRWRAQDECRANKRIEKYFSASWPGLQITQHFSLLIYRNQSCGRMFSFLLFRFAGAASTSDLPFSLFSGSARIMCILRNREQRWNFHLKTL